MANQPDDEIVQALVTKLRWLERDFGATRVSTESTVIGHGRTPAAKATYESNGWSMRVLLEANGGGDILLLPPADLLKQADLPLRRDVFLTRRIENLDSDLRNLMVRFVRPGQEGDAIAELKSEAQKVDERARAKASADAVKQVVDEKQSKIDAIRLAAHQEMWSEVPAGEGPSAEQRAEAERKIERLIAREVNGDAFFQADMSPTVALQSTKDTYSNVPHAIAALTPLVVKGRFDESVRLIETYVEEGRAEGVMKALVVLLETTWQHATLAQKEQSLKDTGLTWMRYADILGGDPILNGQQMTVLAESLCTCGHISADHANSWSLWEAGELSGGSCAANDCACSTFTSFRSMD